MLPVNANLLPSVSRFFDDDWNNLFEWPQRNSLRQRMTLPSVNIHEDSDNYIVEMAVPGMKKSDFDISLHNEHLTIKAISSEKKENQTHEYSLKEYDYGSFKRTFNLNKRVVNDAKIAASYKDGILTVILPKREEVKDKPARIIKIS